MDVDEELLRMEKFIYERFGDLLDEMAKSQTRFQLPQIDPKPSEWGKRAPIPDVFLKAFNEKRGY